MPPTYAPSQPASNLASLLSTSILCSRAEVAVTRALADGSPEDRAALAEKRTVIADADASGQPPGSPAARLAAHLRTLAAHLLQTARQP